MKQFRVADIAPFAGNVGFVVWSQREGVGTPQPDDLVQVLLNGRQMWPELSNGVTEEAENEAAKNTGYATVESLLAFLQKRRIAIYAGLVERIRNKDATTYQQYLEKLVEEGEDKNKNGPSSNKGAGDPGSPEYPAEESLAKLVGEQTTSFLEEEIPERSSRGSGNEARSFRGAEKRAREAFLEDAHREAVLEDAHDDAQAYDYEARNHGESL